MYFIRKSAMLLKNRIPSSAFFAQRNWWNVQGVRTLKAGAKSPQILVSSINSGEEVREYMEVFPQVVKDLTDAEEFKDVPLVNKWFARVLQYNVPTNTKSKSLLISRSYKSLVGARNLTPENKKLAYILTCCFDMFETYMAIHDDIVDATEIRRNSPSWYTLEEVGMNAVNDGVYLENAAYFILTKHFSKHPMYVKLMELFHQASLLTVIGQILDHIKTAEAKANVFTMNNYTTMGKYKAANFPFYFPITLGMYLADKVHPEIHDQLKSPLAELGYILLVQNDFRDVFDNLSLNGKVGTDISKGRYSWMIVTAHQLATDAQKEILKKHYGNPDPESTLIVKNLYEELNLPKICVNHIEERLVHVRADFRRISEQSPHKSFFQYLDSLVAPEDWFAKEYWCT